MDWLSVDTSVLISSSTVEAIDEDLCELDFCDDVRFLFKDSSKVIRKHLLTSYRLFLPSRDSARR
jgi:hypothetical protein